MARVELRNVKKVYPGGIVAVTDLDLDVEDGEFVVLVGPSGCGKSTTLRMVAGLEDLTEGQITIGDRVVNDVAPKDRDIAMVFQNYALYPHMTVFKNMAFGLMIRKYPKSEIKERVGEAARILGIEDLLDRRPKALSGGQRQRVAVGRAMVRQPKVFLFDEPLSNLDAMLRVQMRAEIGKLHSRLETTMIYVTHDQVEAMTMGDRIVVMLDGLIQQIATPTELYRSPRNKFVAGFIGSPPMNFLEGKVLTRNGEMIFVDRAAGVEFPVDPSHRARLEARADQSVVLGIRPEDLHKSISGGGTSPNVSTTVDVVEPLGAETYLYLSVGERSLTARVSSDEIPKVNDTYVLDVAMAKVHYFDSTTGNAIFS